MKMFKNSARAVIMVLVFSMSGCLCEVQELMTISVPFTFKNNTNEAWHIYFCEFGMTSFNRVDANSQYKISFYREKNPGSIAEADICVGKNEKREYKTSFSVDQNADLEVIVTWDGKKCHFERIQDF